MKLLLILLNKLVALVTVVSLSDWSYPIRAWSRVCLFRRSQRSACPSAPAFQALLGTGAVQLILTNALRRSSRATANQTTGHWTLVRFVETP